MIETNEARVARQSIRASAVLLVGNLISSLLLAITVFILARLLGPSDYGEYTIALVIPGTFVLLTGLGLNTALMRYSSYHISKGEIETARRKSRSACYALLLIGVILSVINFFGADFFSVLVFHRPELVSLIQLASLGILGQAMIQAVVAGFIGWTATGYASLGLVVQSVVKLALSPLLVVVGFSVFGAVLGHAVSYIFAGAMFFGLFFILKLRGKTNNSSRVISDVREMMSYGLPEYAGRVISQFSEQSYVVIVLAAITTNVTVAYYQAAYNVTLILQILATIIAQVLLAAFANLDGVGGNIKLAFAHAQKYTLYAVTPIIFFIIGTSNFLMETFYGRVYLGGAIYLQLLSVAFLPFAFGAAVLPPLFNGVAKTKLTLIMFLTSSISLFVLAPVLGVLFHLNVYGLIISLLIANLIQLLVGMLLASKYLRTKFQYKTVLRCLLAVAISYAGMYAATLLGLSLLEELSISIAVFLFLYFTLAPAIGVMNKDEFLQLGVSAQGLGLLSKIISLIISYELRIVRISRGKESMNSK